jgi:Sulfotransferase family
MPAKFLSLLKETGFQAKRHVETAVGQIYIDVDHDYKSTTLLAGSGRGGTTWVMELLNFDNQYRLMFEPLNKYFVPLAKPFSDRQYLRPDDCDSTFLDPMRTIVSGRLRNGWTDRLNRQRFAHKRLIKEIRANLLLSWLHAHFPEIPLILLLRHPCAVVSSQRRVGWSHYDLSVFLSQEPLMSDFLSPFKPILEKATSRFEIHLLFWCIDTLVPLKQFKPGQIHLAFYENFCLQPRRETERLFTFLGKPVNERLFRMLDRPSAFAEHGYGKLPSREALINGWRRDISSSELEIAMETLKRFGLDSLYTEEGLPNSESAFKLLG